MTILERILAGRMVEDDQGNSFPLSLEISAEEGELISTCIRRLSISRTLEIGCAYGISSLYICQAISQQLNPHHIIIDPFQADFHNIGVQNLRRAGFDFWQLIDQLSEFALPSLVQRGVTVQFALIDGYHTFDQALVDFFYVDRLLEDGGVVAFDDAHMAAIDRVIRYVSRYPNYRFLESSRRPCLPKSTRHRLFDFILRPITRIIPEHNRSEYFNDSWLRPAEAMGLGARCVLLQKFGPAFSAQFGMNQDHLKIENGGEYLASVKREWDWYRHF